jgi:hypothetical protein
MYNKGDNIKLKDGRGVNIINLPSTFMSNGSYEVTYQEKRFWVKPEEILYQIDTKWVDDINHYFEIIFDESGINIIPKELSSINVESDREDINRLKFNFLSGRKHSVINFHIGDTVVNDKGSITLRPTKKKKSKIEKVINIIKGEEDEI